MSRKRQWIWIASALCAGALLVALILRVDPGAKDDGTHALERSPSESVAERHDAAPESKDDTDGHGEEAPHGHQGSIHLSDEAIKNAGVTMVPAGPATLQDVTTLPGRFNLTRIGTCASLLACRASLLACQGCWATGCERVSCWR